MSAAPSLRSRAARAAGLVVLSKPLGMGVQLVRSLILTRLLFPEAFGLMVLVGVVLQGLQMCSDVGIGPSIIQHPRGKDEQFLRTAWTLQFIRAGILWLLCCAVAWPAAWFYRQPMLAALLPVAGFGLVLASLHTTARAVNDRELRVGPNLLVGYTGLVANLVVLVTLAWWLRSVWALVIGSLTGTAIEVILGHAMLRGIRHRWAWDRAAAHDLVHFGRWVFFSTVLTFVAMQTDKLLLGKLIDTETLGIYGIALVLAMLPQELAQRLAGVVMFPVLAEKARTDPRRLSQNVMQARGLLLRMGLVMVVGVVVVAPMFFRYLYDPRYRDAAWIAQFLALSTWVAVLNATTGKVLLALGDSRSLALANGVNCAVTVAGCLVGHHLAGLPGFIVGFASGTAAGELMAGLSLRRLGIGVLRQDLRLTLLGLASVGVVLGIAHGTAQPLAVSSHALQGVVGGSVLAGLAFLFLPDLRSILRHRKPARGSA